MITPVHPARDLFSFCGARGAEAKTPVRAASASFRVAGQRHGQRKPRFARHRCSFSAAATPVRQAIAFSFLFFLGKEKKRTKQKPMRRAGPREAITCMQDHEVERGNRKKEEKREFGRFKEVDGGVRRCLAFCVSGVGMILSYRRSRKAKRASKWGASPPHPPLFFFFSLFFSLEGRASVQDQEQEERGERQ